MRVSTILKKDTFGKCLPKIKNSLPIINFETKIIKTYNIIDRCASKTAMLLLVIDIQSSRFLDKLAHLAEIAEIDKSGLVRVLSGRGLVAVWWWD